LAASIAVVLTLDQQLFSNHLYLLLLESGLLCAADSGATLSLDARRRGGRDFIDGWPIVLLKIQFSIVYVFAALTKINPEFLSGESINASLRFGSMPQGLAVTSSYLTIVVELYLAIALWFQATRRTAILFGVLLHVSFVVLLDFGWDLVAFGLEMFALYALFAAERCKDTGDHVPG
jgi:hypothetical protein